MNNNSQYTIYEFWWWNSYNERNPVNPNSVYELLAAYIYIHLTSNCIYNFLLSTTRGFTTWFVFVRKRLYKQISSSSPTEVGGRLYPPESETFLHHYHQKCLVGWLTPFDSGQPPPLAAFPILKPFPLVLSHLKILFYVSFLPNRQRAPFSSLCRQHQLAPFLLEFTIALDSVLRPLLTSSLSRESEWMWKQECIGQASRFPEVSLYWRALTSSILVRVRATIAAFTMLQQDQSLDQCWLLVHLWSSPYFHLRSLTLMHCQYHYKKPSEHNRWELGIRFAVCWAFLMSLSR